MSRFPAGASRVDEDVFPIPHVMCEIAVIWKPTLEVQLPEPGQCSDFFGNIDDVVLTERQNL